MFCALFGLIFNIKRSPGPNYCYRCGNLASVLKIHGPSGDRETIYFSEVEESERKRPERVTVPYFL
uniref:Uncharacterized protein n=1 Tax=Meloidogyne enterolobii TaxID=390850 RepID=A0A6V7V040_MELEN|nr:unnamed protein product [Meloidogyne enterolobii]